MLTWRDREGRGRASRRFEWRERGGSRREEDRDQHSRQRMRLDPRAAENLLQIYDAFKEKEASYLSGVPSVSIGFDGLGCD